MDSIFSELKRRRVYRVALAYGVFASAMIQVGGTILPIFHAPEWAQQILVVLIVAGFPLALVLSWTFDITSEGIIRTPSAHGLRVYPGQHLGVVIFVGCAISLAVLGGYWYWHPWRAAPAESNAAGNAIPARSIAILPFQSLSDDNANALFADGMHDLILTNLAKVSDLRVISHTSVQPYRGEGTRNAREIGRQLGVAYILEGTVSRDATRLRVNARLIDAQTDTQVWANNYESPVTDLFALQSELAKAIVGQLQAKLSPSEKAGIEERTTRDVNALSPYLAAKEIVDTYLEAQDPGASLLNAVRLLTEAIRLDPEFVLAYCYVARAHNLLYFLDLDPTLRRDQLAEEAIATALRLKQDSAEAHLAQADHYFRVHREYDKAQEQLKLARPGLPNDVQFFNLSGYIYRRQGQWSEAERDFASAVKIDPRNPNAVNLLVDTYVLERRFPEAKLCYDAAIAAGMREPIALIRRAALDFGENGEHGTLKAAMAAAPEVDVGGGETSWRVLIAMIEKNYEEALRALAESPRSDFQDVDFSFYFPKSWYEGLVYRAKGDRTRATAAFTSARQILEARLRVKPEDPRTLAVLAQVDVNLGRKEQAVREAQRAVELMPIAKDHYDGPLVLQGLAQVYTWSGEHDRAFDVLQSLLAMPGYISYGYFKTDPQWEPLRTKPRYAVLLDSIKPKS